MSGLSLHPMKALELKVPPPVVAGLIAAAMWVATMLCAPMDVSDFVRRAVAATLAVAGGRCVVQAFDRLQKGVALLGTRAEKGHEPREYVIRWSACPHDSNEECPGWDQGT